MLSLFHQVWCRCNSFVSSYPQDLMVPDSLIYDIEPWRVRGHYILPTKIGYAAVGCAKRTLLVSNLATGIDVYDLPPSNPIQMFCHVVRKNVPIIVASALDDSIAFAGSDDGNVRVFDQQTGVLATILHHGPIGTIVQIVDALSFDAKNCIIASATSDERETRFDIKIWSTKVVVAKQARHKIIMYTNLEPKAKPILPNLSGPNLPIKDHQSSLMGNGFAEHVYNIIVPGHEQR
ncbi:hypothetical protein NP233_g10969 [Leucocoprinus birnbaumii]|uniref:Uncharacterized protein n=1 Tax=Leucocoprinus birnbaumii TaxID=56174 RepID=A0AAD5VL28_9AGAR|nr:hypothetical protein NP233_g10969 [Leucocoprinus birnbaumii]